MTARPQPPPRLAESAGAAGDLVRRALSEQAPADSLPRFTQLQARRAARARRHTAVVLAAAALALVVGVRSWRSSEPPLVVRAEPAPPTTASAASATVSATVAVDEPPPPSPSRAPSRRDVVSKPRAPIGGPSPRAEAEAAAPVKDVPVTSEPVGSAKACAELARGDAEAAIGCYAKLATGSGVTAELAFFEQARLAGKALRQPARALALLDQYRERFPSGSLRAEATLARIEWSLTVGDKARARAEVDEALGSGLLTERRAELERLRATLTQER